MVSTLSEELRSPTVNKDHSVTLNLKSENAKKVEVSSDLKFKESVGQAGPGGLGSFSPMKKISNDVWTATSMPMLPGRYSYVLLVDGLYVLDPLNPFIRQVPTTQGVNVRINVVNVQADEPMPWDVFSDIPHGKVVIEKFYSEVLKQVKGLTIYLPPGYKSTVRYSVLYLLHGASGDYLTWYFDERADNIMDYLIAKGRAKEMIVVMPDGNVMSTGAMRIGVRPTATASPEERKIIAEKHVSYFVKEVMPFVESRYRVSKDSRAIAGLSMGGGQTLNLVTSHPEMFVAAGPFSAALSEDALNRLPSVREHLKGYKLVYVSCGNWDSLLERSRILSKKLDELGIQHIYYSDDFDHVMPFWQRSLTDFVSHLSKTYDKSQ